LFGIVRKGLSPGDSDRFVKVWWEVPSARSGLGKKWAPYANGGSFSPYYRATKEVVEWNNNGDIIRSYCFPDGRPKYVVRSSVLYGKPGLTFGKRGDVLNVQILPAGQTFSNEGYLILPNRDEWCWQLLGYMNSLPARYLVNMVCGLHKEVGAIKVLPIPDKVINSIECSSVGEKSKRIYNISRLLNFEETNPECNFLTYSKLYTFANLSNYSIEYISKMKVNLAEIARLENDINLIICNIVDISDSEWKALLEELGGVSDSDDEVDGDKAATDKLFTTGIISFCVGTCFGRWDVRFASDEKDAPEISDPFVPLPVCPPGMLLNAQHLPAESQDVTNDYPLRISWPGIIVDDEGHTEDIISRAREAIEVIWKEKAGNIEHEACEILGVRSLRDYFAKPSGFFADHLKRYSKSRRQAPIYWPISTASGSYTLWIYYHRLNDQTIYTCVNDFVEPKLRDIAIELTTLRQNGIGRSHDDEKKLENLQDFEIELQEFRDELLRVARLPWKPNLNDGVQITAAPLWKLFQLPKWKKTLKETWGKLEKGDYDWAHLAYSIWPDRVLEKCKKDKSLAIAHNLEELYEEPPASAKKKRSKKAVVV
jgi:hypothetical protein